MGIYTVSKMSISHAIALVVLCIATAVAKKTDFQASTVEFMKVINIHVSDLHGVVGNSFSELAKSSDAQGLLKRTIHTRYPEMDTTDVATALKGKVMPHIPERSQISLSLHMTSDDRAVALAFVDQKGNSAHKMALPKMKMSLSREMLLEADLKEIESELEADSKDSVAHEKSLKKIGGLPAKFSPGLAIGGTLIAAGLLYYARQGV